MQPAFNDEHFLWKHYDTRPRLNLIENALRYAKEVRYELTPPNYGISEPLTPKAQRNVLYLMIRESVMRGSRQACKLVLNPYRRSNVYGILVKACMQIFHYGKKSEILDYYNEILYRLIGAY